MISGSSRNILRYLRKRRPVPVKSSVAPRLERSSGCTRLSFKSAPSGTAIDELYQQGCCKVRFPQSTNGTLEAVLLNTAGGLTDGDTLSNEICWRRGTQATVTTQAAERIYRAATRDVARVTTRISIDDDCLAAWLPQETIVFDGARLARTLKIDMKSTSRLVALESIVFGRRAMGESVDCGAVSDRWLIRIDGRPAFSDNFLVDDQLTGPVAEYLDRASVANSAHCVATLVIVADDCNEIVEAARKFAQPTDAIVGATRLDRLAVLRILAGDSQAMRTAVGQIVASLGGTLDVRLPRVWHC